MLEQIKEAADFIRSRVGLKPDVGIILGTGLGRFTNEMEITDEMDYADIPNFPVSTVESHQGKLVFGTLSGKKTVAMKGRFHYYEGYSLQQVAFPVWVMKQLGIRYLLVSNASGALSPDLFAGDLMIVKDHINLQPGNPLIGINEEALGPRFPDMAHAYHPLMIEKAMAAGKRNGIDLKTGIYVSVPGPVLETQAEYKYLRAIGGDAVGMSTVPEIIAARQGGISCFAISVITDEGWHEVPAPITIEQVIETARETEPKMTAVMKGVLQEIENNAWTK